MRSAENFPFRVKSSEVYMNLKGKNYRVVILKHYLNLDSKKIFEINFTQITNLEFRINFVKLL